jgi:hypothetical protein
MFTVAHRQSLSNGAAKQTGAAVRPLLGKLNLEAAGDQQLTMVLSSPADSHIGVAPATFTLPPFSWSASPRAFRQIEQSQFAAAWANCSKSLSSSGQPSQATPWASPGTAQVEPHPWLFR